MSIIPSDDIFLLKQRLFEQDALIQVLLEKLNEREREIERLQAELDKLRRMNFGSRSEKLSRSIAQMEARLTALQQESDVLTGRVDDSAVPMMFLIMINDIIPSSLIFLEGVGANQTF
jgi:transposase